jgi:L-malate glycosyltransferase
MTRVVYFSGGLSVYDRFFLTKLSRQFQVALLTFTPTPDLGNIGVNVIDMPEIIGRLPAHDGPRIYSTIPMKVLLLKRWLKDLSPDVLIGCSLDYGFCAALSHYQPFFSFIWGSEVLIKPSFFPLRAQIKYVLRNAAKVLVDSEVQINACRRLGCSRSKIVSLPWVDSVDLEQRMNKIAQNRTELRARFGWDEGDPVIICTRSHYSLYNVEAVLRAAPRVLQEERTAKFLLVGGGPMTANLKRLARGLGLNSSAVFTGYVDNTRLLSYLKGSDIYVSSSLSDGTSASLIEAMISKLPCVVSDIPGNREWIVNNENGLLFPPRDSDRLASLLVDLFRDDRLRAKLGQAGYETSRMKGDWGRNSAELISAIQSLGLRTG